MAQKDSRLCELSNDRKSYLLISPSTLVGGGRRRSQLEVSYDILRHAASLARHALREEDYRIPKSRLQYKVYVSWSRLKRYLTELVLAGLIDERTLIPTKKGLKFIGDFESFQKRLIEEYRLVEPLSHVHR